MGEVSFRRWSLIHIGFGSCVFIRVRPVFVRVGGESPISPSLFFLSPFFLDVFSELIVISPTRVSEVNPV